MKKRSTVDKNEWSITRENRYKSDSIDIAYTLGFTLLKREASVYKIENNTEMVFCVATNPKTLWFETWLKLCKLR